MEILAIIPARGGSKGIPNKNVKILAGKPLIYYSIEAGQNSKYVTRTVLSTEAENVKKVALEYGCEVIDRPMELVQEQDLVVKMNTVIIRCIGKQVLRISVIQKLCEK